MLRVVLVKGLLHLTMKSWMHWVTKGKLMLSVKLTSPEVITNRGLIGWLLQRLLLLVLGDGSNSSELLFFLDIE